MCILNHFSFVICTDIIHYIFIQNWENRQGEIFHSVFHVSKVKKVFFLGLKRTSYTNKSCSLLHLLIMSLYPFLQLFVLYLESTQASCSLYSYREAAPDLEKQPQTLILPLLKNLLIWRWYIVPACLYFLVLLSALSSALQNPVSLRYLKAGISLCFTWLNKLRSSLFLSHLQPNNFQTKKKCTSNCAPWPLGICTWERKPPFQKKNMPQDFHLPL